MTQPTPYNRQNDYTEDFSGDEGTHLNAEFDAVEETLDEVLTNLELIQKDDGSLANSVVGPDAFTPRALALMGGSWEPQGAWVTATAYAVGDVVEEGGVAYVCAVAHTSGTFATDDAAGYWVSFGVSSATPGANSVTKAMLETTATDVLLGRSTSGTGNYENITCTAAGRALLDDADATAQRVTLGLVIGTNVQAYDAELAAIAGLTSAADKGIQFTGSGTAAVYDLTTAGKALLDDANAAAQRVTLGLEKDAIIFVIDGGGATITTGIKGDLMIPFACTITSAYALADQSGSIVVDVWKDTYANFPPTDADTITASTPVTISTALKGTDSTLSGWTVAISAGDILRFNVDSCTSIQRCTVVLNVTK